MKYRVEYLLKAQKQIDKLDPQIRLLILTYINKNLNDCENPRFMGKALKGKLKNYWRYRVGKYRLICLIEDDKILITVIEVGNRKEIY